MAPPNSVLSKTLHSITLTKIRELSKLRGKYEHRKQAVLDRADAAPKDDVQTRIDILLDGVEELLADNATGLGTRDVSNIELSTEQSRYDASVPGAMLAGFETQLRDRLDVQSRRLAMADLYSKLLQEWISPDGEVAVGADGEADDAESFEVVEGQRQRLQELCDKFEAVVFEPLQADEEEIEEYLSNLCESGECVKALDTIRGRIDDFGKTFSQMVHPFDQTTLKWCIKGLLAEDLLSDDKQSTLQEFLRNDVVLQEIADVLNMRFADLENWDWDAGEEGIPVMPRQQLNGKYRIWMDEDVLQAILTHYIGIRWCIELRSRLLHFVQTKGVWNWDNSEQLSPAEIERYQYYCGKSPSTSNTVMTQRKSDYLNTFFLSQLPASTESFYAGGGYDDDNAEDWTEGKKQKSSSTQQKLLRKLATEALLHQHLHGEVALVQSDLKWFGTSISHTTVFSLLRFVGFSETWIAFFKKYLQPMLNLSPSTEEGTRGPRKRLRGLPMAHAAEKLIGELVLFFMDFAVHRESGCLLYRLHDDLWLVDEPSKCAEAWQTMDEFAKVMGLEFNKGKTGSAYLIKEGKAKDPAIEEVLPRGKVGVGFLKFNAGTGDWLIDEAQVYVHLQQLQKQLNGSSSILTWIQTWNSCIGRFFGNTFGEPAYCFGRKHVDVILETHKEIQDDLFPDSNMTSHLREMIKTRFNVDDLPDGFFYLPEQLGGLGVRNPFVPALLVRDTLDYKYVDPHKQFPTFFESEREAYEETKKWFDEMPAKLKAKRLLDYRDVVQSDEAETFFSFEEFTKAREAHSSPLGSLYTTLQTVPSNSFVRVGQRIRSSLEEVGISKRSGDEDIMWLAQLHSQDVFRMCGDMRMIDNGFLPLGVLQMIRAKKVRWQMVL